MKNWAEQKKRGHKPNRPTNNVIDVIVGGLATGGECNSSRKVCIHSVHNISFEYKKEKNQQANYFLDKDL